MHYIACVRVGKRIQKALTTLEGDENEVLFPVLRGSQAKMDCFARLSRCGRGWGVVTVETQVPSKGWDIQHCRRNLESIVCILKL